MGPTKGDARSLDNSSYRSRAHCCCRFGQRESGQCVLFTVFNFCAVVLSGCKFVGVCYYVGRFVVCKNAHTPCAVFRRICVFSLVPPRIKILRICALTPKAAEAILMVLLTTPPYYPVGSPVIVSCHHPWMTLTEGEPGGLGYYIGAWGMIDD